MSQLSPAPKFAVTYVNASGYTVPAVGYKLYTYTAGTSTPKATYTDYTLGSSNTNPVVMDARGECNLWLSGNYKLVLKTDADVTVWTVDEVRDLTSSQTLTNMTLAGTLTVTSTAVTWSGNPTHSGNHTWTGNQVFNGNVTIGDSAADTLTITPNAVTWSNNPTHSGNHTFSGTTTFSSATTVNTFGGTFGNVARAGNTVLDWYEENTFTPVLSFGGGTTGITYSTQSGRYLRFGRECHILLSIVLSSKGSSTGTANIGGLPFTSSSTQIFMPGHYYNMTGLAAPMITFTNPSSTVLLPYTTALATGTPSSATDASFTNTTDVFINAWYEVA
jgi:hypothetical protein